jgi:hypothetical protein
MVAWDPSLYNLKPFLTSGGILILGTCLASKQEIALLNVYGPCVDKHNFWSNLDAIGLLSIPNLVIGGDLILILSAEENWGGSFLPGPSEDFFKGLFDSNHLIDVRPSRLTPTWRNGRSGSAEIARRLDRFLVAENILSTSGFPASWVEFPFVSDHAPILLRLRLPALHLSPPFKFNHGWLSSEAYSDLVHGVWSDPCFLSEANPQRRLVWKLSTLKSKSKAWFHELKKQQFSNLHRLESEISQILHSSALAALTLEESASLKRLESERASLLIAEENSWHLRSRQTWLKCGD